MVRLWGSSPTNLWATGPGDFSLNSLWHYDGTAWKRTSQNLSSSLNCVWGFDSSDVWICDSPQGRIFHFNGNLWQQVEYASYPGYIYTDLYNIWGSKPNEIFIAGTVSDSEWNPLGILLHYNGVKWEFIKTPETKMSFIWVRKSSENNYLYLTGVIQSPTGDTYKLFRFDGTRLEEIFSGSEVSNPFVINGRIYLRIGKKIYKDINKKLELWKDFSQTNYRGYLSGRNEKDFFCNRIRWIRSLQWN